MMIEDTDDPHSPTHGYYSRSPSMTVSRKRTLNPKCPPPTVLLFCGQRCSNRFLVLIIDEVGSLICRKS